MSDSYRDRDQAVEQRPAKVGVATARSYVLAELERLRKDLTGAPSGLSVSEWGQLWDQVGLVDYSIRASLQEGREPDWSVYMKRLSRFCDVPLRTTEYPT